MRRPIDPASIVLASAEAITLDELGAETTPRLKQLVGAAGVTLYRHTPRGQVEGLAGDLRHELTLYHRELSADDPTQRRAHRLEPKPRVVLATRGLDRRAFEHCAAYADYYRRVDTHHITCVWLTDRPYASPGMMGLLVTRCRSQPEFGAREESLLYGVLPALATAVRRCERVDVLARGPELLDAAAEALERGASLVVDGEGRLVWISPEAQAALAGRAPPPLLIAEARRLVALADAAATDRERLPRLALPVTVAPGTIAHAALELVTTPSGRRLALVRLEIARDAEARSGALGRLASHFGLTPAEARVLRLVALGEKNSAIAARLRISIETARTHVKSILAKLGVETRAQAAVAVWSAEPDTQ